MYKINSEDILSIIKVSAKSRELLFISPLFTFENTTVFLESKANNVGKVVHNV